MTLNSNNIILISTLTIILFSLISCSEIVDLNTDGDPTNIVYCLLDPDDELQYVRVGRSFNMSTDPLATKLSPDSIYWKTDFSVYMEEWSENQILENVYHFQPDNEQIKEPGIFPVTGLGIYSGEFKPKRLKTYAIYIHFKEDNRITSGWTTIPEQIIIYDPKPLPQRKINLQTNSYYTIRWKPASLTGAYQTVFNFLYEEKSLTETSIKMISLSSKIELGLSVADLESTTFSGNRFFSHCLETIDSLPEGTREMISATFNMYVSGEELGLYLIPKLNSNSTNLFYGDYTNLINGIGLFSSLSATSIPNLKLSNTTLDELAHSSETRYLGFLDHYGKR